MRQIVALRMLAVILVCALSASGSVSSVAAESSAVGPIYTRIFSDKAVSGYDVVSYFSDGRAVPGSTDFGTTYGGKKWLFVSDAHRALFLAEPTKYAPQYGGYCAYAAAAKNDLVSADPEAWKIVDGKLYLNYDKDIQKEWEANQSKYIELADQNWPALSKR